MIDVFEIGASLNVHGNGMDFMKAFSSALMGAHGQLEALEKKIGATKGAMKDLFIGAGEVFAGAEVLKGITHLAEAGKELNHQQSMLMRNGVNQRDVLRETSAIYKDMLTAVPTASAVDFLRTLGELKTVKGSIAGAREALTQSLKIEGLIGNSTGKSAEGQGYDFWRAVEDKGIIQDKAKTDAMLNRMVQGTIATGGKIGGNDWFTYARRAGSAWMGDDIEAMPLQLMEMQTLGASGAGVARRAFANRTEGAIKLTKAQMRGWDEIGMLGPNGSIRDSQLEQSRPDLFIGKVIDALKAHGLESENQVKAWAAHALHGKDADYFMTAYAGMSEVDPESGLTRLQKERRNMGEAQPLDKAYKTMMGTDFEANMHALQEQWKSFTEAVGGPAAKAMIPVLQGVTSFVTSMATFADKNQKLTQFGVDIAAAASGLLILGGSLRLLRGSLRLMGGGLFGMGRSVFGGSATALNGSAAQLDASALALKEAAAALGGRSVGTPGTGGGPGGGKTGGPGIGSLVTFGLGLATTAFSAPGLDAEGDRRREANSHMFDWLGNPMGAITDRMFGKGRKAGDVIGDWWKAHTAAPAAAPGMSAHPDDDRATRARASDSEGWRQQQDLMKAASQQFGSLNEKTGFVLTSFSTLKDVGGTLNAQFGNLNAKSTSLDNVFKLLEATGIGAARALAEVAMSGGAGGGSGFTNASWGGGGGGRGMSGGGWDGNPVTVAGGFGGGGWAKSGASRPEVAAYIKHAFGAQGIDPEIALKVAQSEGLNSYVGDYGTSFGAFQLHYGGSGIRGMNSGGLGDRFTRETGLNARDPSTWKAQIDYAAKTAKHEGWGAWHGWHGPARAGMDWHGSVPTAGPTSSPRQVSPGAPAGGTGPRTGAVTAQNVPPIVIEHHSHTYLDGKRLAHEVTRHQVADARFRRSAGQADTYGRRAHPGSEVIDA